MARKASRVDRNQSEIVLALRKAGATVQHLHTVGQGCPDILAGYQGRNILFEIKDGEKKPSERKLTPDEVKWHSAWNGQVSIVLSAEDALWELGAI